MANVDKFLDMMNSTMTVATLAGLSTDGYGTATYTTGDAYRCRIVQKHQLVRSFAGIEETSKQTAWVASTSTFPASAQFTFPDGSTPELLAVEVYPDGDGVHHVKLMFE